MILCNYRPAVIKTLYVASACVYHGLYADRHAGDELDAPFLHMIMRDLGVFMHLSSDAVSDEFPDYGEASGSNVVLNGSRYLEEMVAASGELDAFEEALSCA